MAKLMSLVEDYGTLQAAGESEEAAAKLAEIQSRLGEHDMQLFAEYWALMAPAFELAGPVHSESARLAAETAWRQSRNKLVLGSDWKPQPLDEIFRAGRKNASQPK